MKKSEINIDKEIWKDIEGWEGAYKVSNLGNVKSIDRIVFDKGRWRETERMVKGKFLKKGLSPIGYYVVSLCKNGICKSINVHSLVAKTFIPNPENKPEINHINAIRSDNRVENLEWVNRSENMLHAFKIGSIHIAKGEASGSSKLKNEDVLMIREMHGNGHTCKSISNLFNVSDRHIYDIINRKNWKHI